MEVKINREIRQYTESMFFGLSMRQFFFSLAAAAVAVFLYFVLKPYLGTETVSWVCILGAVPFAAMGFVTYHGMTAEQFIWAWIRSELLEPKRLHFESVNTYQLLVNGEGADRSIRKGPKGRNAYKLLLFSAQKAGFVNKLLTSRHIQKEKARKQKVKSEEVKADVESTPKAVCEE